MFLTHRFVLTPTLLICLICVATVNSQTRNSSSGKFVDKGETTVPAEGAFQLKIGGPPPPDCPQEPDCPDVALAAEINNIEKELRLSQRDNFAIVFRPSRRTVLSKLGLSIYQGNKLTYESNSTCRGCGRTYEPFNKPTENSITGYLFDPNGSIQTAISRNRRSPERVVIIITAKAESGEFNKEDFFFVKMKTNRIVRPVPVKKTPNLTRKTKQ